MTRDDASGYRIPLYTLGGIEYSYEHPGKAYANLTPIELSALPMGVRCERGMTRKILLHSEGYGEFTPIHGVPQILYFCADNVRGFDVNVCHLAVVDSNEAADERVYIRIPESRLPAKAYERVPRSVLF